MSILGVVPNTNGRNPICVCNNLGFPVFARKITVILGGIETENQFLMKKLLLIVLPLFTLSCAAQPTGFRTLKEVNGKVGIGTNTPDELLTVKGTIHTQEVKVDLEGAVAPDYVFEAYFKGYSTLAPSYEMPTLTALRAYLEKEGHLPGVPSAQELSEEGMNLKEMNLLLLQKVEELTLYTLEQQQEVEALKQEVEKLRQGSK